MNRLAQVLVHEMRFVDSPFTSALFAAALAAALVRLLGPRCLWVSIGGLLLCLPLWAVQHAVLATGAMAAFVDQGLVVRTSLSRLTGAATCVEGLAKS